MPNDNLPPALSEVTSSSSGSLSSGNAANIFFSFSLNSLLKYGLRSIFLGMKIKVFFFPIAAPSKKKKTPPGLPVNTERKCNLKKMAKG